MSASSSVIDILRAHAAELHVRFGVRKPGVFGSCARGDERASSDVDILVDFTEVSFDRYMDLEFFLEEKLHRQIDLVMESASKPALRDSILREVRSVA